MPLTEDVIRGHLTGVDPTRRGWTETGAAPQPTDDFVLGLYPLLGDETCSVLAIDSDKAGWEDDARTFVDVCRRHGVSPALECPRSGNGAHARLFFAERCPPGRHGLSVRSCGRPAARPRGGAQEGRVASARSRSPAVLSADGQLAHPDARVLEHNGAPVRQIIGDRCQIVEQQSHLGLRPPAHTASEENDRRFRLPTESEQGSEIGIRRDQDAVLAFCESEHFRSSAVCMPRSRR